MEELRRELIRERERTVAPFSQKGKHRGSVALPSEGVKGRSLSEVDLPATVRSGEIRLKRMSGRRRCAVLFVVDASRSQGAGERLAFAKGAAMAILEKAYCSRDRVGMILFGNRKAEVALPYTGSMDFAADRLRELKAKGNTPLAMGLRLAVRTQELDHRKHPDDAQLIVLLTDGKCNYDEKPDPLSQALAAAEEIRRKKMAILLIDTERSVFGLGLARKIADAAGAAYISL